MVTKTLKDEMKAARGISDEADQEAKDGEEPKGLGFQVQEAGDQSLPSLLGKHRRLEEEMQRMERDAANRHDAAADEYERLRLKRLEAEQKQAAERQGLRIQEAEPPRLLDDGGELKEEEDGGA
jgi:hypothetical protein